MTKDLENLLAAGQQLLDLASTFPSGPRGKPEFAIQSIMQVFRENHWPPTLRRAVKNAQPMIKWLNRIATTDRQHAAVAEFSRAAEALWDWSPRLEFPIDVAKDLLPDCKPDPPILPEELLNLLRPVVNPDVLTYLDDVALCIVEAPYPAVPSPRESHYTMIWNRNTAVETSRSSKDGINTLMFKDDNEAIAEGNAVVATLVPESKQPVFVVSGFWKVAYVTTSAVAREHWWPLLTSGPADDGFIFPADGSWTLGYFHHGWAWAARLHGERLFAIELLGGTDLTIG